MTTSINKHTLTNDNILTEIRINGGKTRDDDEPDNRTTRRVIGALRPVYDMLYSAER